MPRVNTLMLPLLIFVFMVTSACAPKTPMPNIKAEYYPQCFAPFKELNDYQNRLQRRTIGYTAGAAAAGAGVGALTGFLSSGGDWRGALLGGLTGAIAGAATGYTIAKVEEIKDQNKRLAAYRDVMSADLVNATDVELTALRSLKCYVQEFEQLQQSYAEQRISREEFAKRYAEIKAGITELGKITGDSQTLIAQRDIEMRASLQKEAAKGQSTMEPLPTVEQRRMEREKKAKIEAAQRQKTQRKQRRRKTPAADEASASLAMSDLKSDLDKLTEEVQADKTKYQDQQLMLQPKPAGPNGQQAASAAPAAPVNMQQIAATYNEYPDKVLQMEAVEKQRMRTLEIMNDAASKTGIDMV